jgi:transcriptional regulator with XRE-family HTH domain
MLFGEKLKSLRIGAEYTQDETAGKLGVSLRTYQNYEWCRMYPKQTDIYGRISKLFDVSADWLLGDEDRYVMDAHAKGGAKSRKDVQELLTEVGGLFAGGELSDDDKDKVMRTINDLYWKAKDNNRKYANGKKTEHVQT